MCPLDFRPRLLGLAAAGLLTLAGCNSNQTLSEQERAVQAAADEQVALTLFDADLDRAASYNVHKDGFVVIRFKREVAADAYTDVVDRLRSNPRISGVRAEQGGREVCILGHGRRRD